MPINAKFSNVSSQPLMVTTTSSPVTLDIGLAVGLSVVAVFAVFLAFLIFVSLIHACTTGE